MESIYTNCFKTTSEISSPPPRPPVSHPPVSTVPEIQNSQEMWQKYRANLAMWEQQNKAAWQQHAASQF